MKTNKILAGIAFDKDTEKLMAYTSLFARTFHASVHLLFVLDYLVTPPGYLIPYLEEEKRIAEADFNTLMQQLAERGIRTDAEVMGGRLQESFETAAKKTNSDMIVLGFMSHVFRRSSSEKLIKGLRMPMLVVRGEKADNARLDSVKIRKVLCPVDFSEISENALAEAKEICTAFSAQLDILHIISDSVIKKIAVSEERDRALLELRAGAEETLSGYLGAPGIEVQGKTETGEPHKRIAAYAQENDVDLIVMGARGLGLIKGMLIGSVTDAVLKSAPCPVFVLH